MHDWKDVYANFTLIDAKSLKILSSLVAYLTALLKACPKYVPLKG
jgi:hypothetical protein